MADASKTRKVTIQVMSPSWALTVLFVALKLCHVIDWSWLWVLSPLWAGWAIIVGLVAIFVVLAVAAIAAIGLGYGVWGLFSWMGERKARRALRERIARMRGRK